MERTMNGRELRNALLYMAQQIHDDETKPVQEWLDEVHGTILGTSDGALCQKEIVKTVARMVLDEPKMLRALSGEIGNWSPAALARAIREYGKEYGLSLSRKDKGWQVAFAAC